MEAMPASGNDRGLELENRLIAEPRGIGEIARRAADGGNQAFVRVHAHQNLMGQARHGHRSFARAISHASRQSGQ